MKNLLYKEIKLVVSPSVYLFSLLAALMLIPAYPYWVSLFYCFLGVQITFQMAQVNLDQDFTAMLPVPRKHIVLSKHILLVYIELVQILISIPFAILTNIITPTGNIVGIDANMALYGFVLIGYGLFNIAFLPNFFKTGYKVGLPFCFGLIAFALMIAVVETSMAIFPTLKNALDGNSNVLVQAITLVVGIALYFALTYFSYIKARKKFDKVNL